MKYSKKIIVCSICTIIIIGAIIFLITRQPKKNTVAENTNENNTDSVWPVELPGTVFDGRIGIPLTNISAAYPTKGFYDIGVKFIPYNLASDAYGVIGGIGITEQTPIDDVRASEYIGVDLDVRKVGKNENLNTLIKYLNNSQSPEYRPNGVTKTINGNVYYIAKTTQGLTVYDAYTLKNKQYIHVGFKYDEATGSLNRAASDNNEKLFYDYLNNFNIQESAKIYPPRFPPMSE
jgi:hypothetical protein